MSATAGQSAAQPAADCSPGPISSAINDPATAHGRVGLEFKRAMVAVRRMRGRETHRPGQLSYAQFGLLFGLAQRPGCSARELADHADLTPATVTQMLEHLELTGLITRTRSAQDRRVVTSELTPHGSALVTERQTQMERRWRSALAEFDDAELAAAARVMNRLATYFDELLEAPEEEPQAGPAPA